MQKSTKNRSKIVQNGSLGLSGGAGGHLGAKRHQDPQKEAPEKIDKPHSAPSWAQNPSQIDQNSIKNAIKKSIDL